MTKKKALTCEGCAARCCQYVAVQIDKPTTKRDYDNLRWMLLHAQTHVYIDHDGDWILQVDVPCQQIDHRTHRCRIYAKRPKICQELTTEECEREGHDSEVWFHDARDLERWLDSRRRKRKKK